MSPTISIRPALPSDCLCLSVLAMQVYLDTYAQGGIRTAIASDVLRTFDVQRFATWVNEPKSPIFIAEAADHMVGFAHVTLGVSHALSPGSQQSELLRLYVQEPFTGKGVGTSLLKHAESAAARAGTDVLWLTPWVGNTRAIGFYRAQGYADCGQTWYDIDGERIENRVFAKAVQSAA